MSAGIDVSRLAIESRITSHQWHGWPSGLGRASLNKHTLNRLGDAQREGRELAGLSVDHINLDRSELRVTRAL